MEDENCDFAANAVPEDLTRATREWYLKAEDYLCELHDVIEKDQIAKRGRAFGLKTEMVSLQRIWATEVEKKFSMDTQNWRRLDVASKHLASLEQESFYGFQSGRATQVGGS